MYKYNVLQKRTLLIIRYTRAGPPLYRKGVRYIYAAPNSELVLLYEFHAK